MSLDFNNPNFPLYTALGKNVNEDHDEPGDQSIKSNVKGHEHPFFTSNGAIQVINTARELSNTAEVPLTGKVKDKVFEDLAKAARETKIPYELLMLAADWDKDLTKRLDATDAKKIAQTIVQYVPEVRKAMGRDPYFGELFMAYTLGDAGKVKELHDKNEKEPEEEATPPGSKKDDIIANKKRGEKTQKRTNRELYDFFYKRTINGKVSFLEDLGKDINAALNSSVASALGGNFSLPDLKGALSGILNNTLDGISQKMMSALDKTGILAQVNAKLPFNIGSKLEEVKSALKEKIRELDD